MILLTLNKGTLAGGQFGWGGTLPKRYRQGLYGKLIQVGNLELSVKAKAYLTVFRTARNAEMKVGLSDPT